MSGLRRGPPPRRRENPAAAILGPLQDHRSGSDDGAQYRLQIFLTRASCGRAVPTPPNTPECRSNNQRNDDVFMRHGLRKGRVKRQHCRPRLDFGRVNRAALAVLPELVALNPTRYDRHLGSFQINLRTEQWSDFATGDKDGDPVSLAQREAAEKLPGMLGIEVRYGR